MLDRKIKYRRPSLKEDYKEVISEEDYSKLFDGEIPYEDKAQVRDTPLIVRLMGQYDLLERRLVNPNDIVGIEDLLSKGHPTLSLGSIDEGYQEELYRCLDNVQEGNITDVETMEKVLKDLSKDTVFLIQHFNYIENIILSQYIMYKTVVIGNPTTINYNPNAVQHAVKTLMNEPERLNIKIIQNFGFNRMFLTVYRFRIELKKNPKEQKKMSKLLYRLIVVLEEETKKYPEYFWFVRNLRYVTGLY